MNLFQLGNFQLNSGKLSPVKIECDALTDADWECLAFLAHLKIPKFRDVHGVPRGGIKFAKALQKYKTFDGPILIAEDVCTTGRSMEIHRSEWARHNDCPLSEFVGVAAFGRGQEPDWVRVICRVEIP